jgi:hypothetical protein
MKGIYLGDSYDIIKRFWSESLKAVAPLRAHPRFVPAGIRARYTAMTSIQVLDADNPPGYPFGLMLDPDTGVRLPADISTGVTSSHIPLQFIVCVNERMRPTYMICFDQSYHRRHELSRAEQLEVKRAFLQRQGLSSFYYNSHAPFLFMSGEVEILKAVRSRLISLGVPEERFTDSAGGADSIVSL